MRPSASAWYFGWMIDWITTLMTEYSTMTASMRPGPPSSRPMIAGGITPMTNPTFGMKFVTNARTPQTNAPGIPSRASTTVSMAATMRPNTVDTVR